MAPNAGPIAVFGTRGRLPALEAKTLELEDALAAAQAADGYSRATGDAAILLTSDRVDALRAASAIPTSWGDRIPLIVVNLVPREDAELVRQTYEPVVRGSIVMQPAETVGAVVARLREALGGGVPAQLIGSDDSDARALLAAVSKLEPPAEVTAEPDAADVARIARSLQAFERPALLLGREGVLRVDLGGVAELAARLRCPVLLTAAAAGLPRPWATISDRVPLLANPNAAWTLTFLRADGILALGTDLPEGDLFGLHDIPIPRKRVLCVGQREIGAPELCCDRVQHDPGSFVEALLARLDDSPPPRSRERWVRRSGKALEKLRSISARAADRSRHERPIDPAYAACRIVERCRPDTIFLAEGNSAGMWLRSFHHLRPIVFPVLMGSIGVAIPWAAGVGFGRPRCPVWGVLGDGGFFYQLRVLRDLVRLGHPAVFFVLNDSSFSSIRLEQTYVFVGRTPGTDLPTLDYAGLARLHGCEGRVVQDPRELDEAIDEALGWSDLGKRPLVVDVRIADSVPFAGIAFALAELDHVWGSMWPSIVASFVLAAIRGKLPWRVVAMLTRLWFV